MPLSASLTDLIFLALAGKSLAFSSFVWSPHTKNDFGADLAVHLV
jgi:hypothetical protein